MNYFYLDFETRSRADLKKVGARNYAQDPSTEVISVAYAYDDSPVQRSTTAINLPTGVFVAHNKEFEEAILKYQYGFDQFQWVDTMALAAQMSLPLSLKELAKFFGLAKGETRAVMKLSKPRRKTDEYWEVEDAEEDYEELYEYNINDVEVMRQCHKRMIGLTTQETRIWELTRRMNERGVKVDMPAIGIALPLLATETNALTASFVASTGCSPRSPSKLAKYFGLSDVKAETVKQALKDSTLAPSKRELIQLRSILGRSSVSKLKALQLRSSSDGRLRGSLLYSGAQRTGRWSSKGVQLQNLPRGMGTLTDDAFTWLHSGQLTKLLGLVPEMIRGFFLGPFIVGDYAQIEARLLAWLAQDKRQLAEWAAGKDLYRQMASRIYNKSEKDVTDHERFIGKQTVLGCGYGMGGEVRHGKLSKFQSQLADKFGVNVSPELAALAVRTYRNVYSPVVQLWYGLERMFRGVIASKSGRADAFGVTFERQSVCNIHYILVTLPSGSRLYYANPVNHSTGELETFSPRRGYGQGPGPDKLYGGKLVENIVQRLARDILASAMLELDEKGFKLALTVHDEIVSEDDGRVEEFTAIMKRTPEWAKGLPLDVEVFQCARYRK